jgi:chromosome segregation protein
MHLRSITMKGFKSFPGRTRLEFGPGVSVIVGPNGSGKSNITDAVLWALGEQSPLAVRGQTMRDVIFAGGHGVKGSGAAEVEVAIDNHDHALDSEFSEISIVRRLGRDGEGEYRLNGARCRLVDVLEVLSDSGLGKEMHSVVSQGKVEAIVLSRPRERRLLIEEAAGLGKHRKRRRRAQLKLERTGENLSRALDVEREARSRLRPLKRQAEAAQLHERIERQALEARLELVGDDVRAMRLELGAAESQATSARRRRDEAERLLAAVAERREAAEQSFAAQGRARESLQTRLFAARSAADRIGMRLERARDTAATAGERGERRRSQLELLESAARGAAPGRDVSELEDPAARVEALERELAALDAGREQRLAEELAGLEAERAQADRRREELESGVGELRDALEGADRRAEEARAALRRAERVAESARGQAARAGTELAGVNQFVVGASAPPPGVRSLAEGLNVEPGYELALSAALGPLLAAGLVDDLQAGQDLLDAAGEQGGTALVSSRARGRRPGHAPLPGAQRLLAHMRPEPKLRTLAERLLADVWVVDSLERVSAYFDGVAVTRAGRLLDASTGGLSQAPAGGPERLLESLGRRGELVAASERAAAGEREARAALEKAGDEVRAADRARDEAEVALRRRLREAQESAEEVARCDWAIARRRETPDQGPDAIRRAELAADLRAERRQAERLERERAERLATIAALRHGIEHDAGLAARAERAAGALAGALAAVGKRRDALEAELEVGAAAGEATAATLRACAHEEAELQGRLREASEAVTVAEVAAQQVRDAAAERERELAEIAAKLGLSPDGESARATDPPPADPLGDERRGELAARIERLARRREQLGPVNPLAAHEYEEAVAHVEELESQRGDLETALAELEGLIRDIDRRIREAFEQTFDAAARNFEEVVGHLFPGGRGRLRLVQAEQGPRPVIGDASPEDEAVAPADDAGEQEPDSGVEVEVTPAGKATRRLSLLSGGEKSLVALAFMFAVFLARPCPFYILDEVEAALDDVNIDRFLELVRRYSDRAQFIVVTHQKRTMDAADTLYGVSMGGDGISRVVSRRLGGAPAEAAAADVRVASA